MTTGEIFVVVLIKGALVALLAKLGWWPNWEERAKRREEDARVLRAYHEWSENAGPEATAQVSIALDRIAKRPRPRWPLKK